jgi:hypothetical protein
MTNAPASTGQSQRRLAHTAGWEAGAVGKTEMNNPFPLDSVESDWWLMGLRYHAQKTAIDAELAAGQSGAMGVHA